MEEAGFEQARPVQEITMSRILGGQDLIVIGPEGCGRTTSYILGILMKLKYALEEAPRALVLVPTKEQVDAVVEEFQKFSKQSDIRVLGMYAGPKLEVHMDALADGADIVVGTPDRVRATYLKLGLNINKIKTFVLDNADEMVKLGQQLPVIHLMKSIPKTQKLVYSEVMHEKLDHMLKDLLKVPATIEIDGLGDELIETHDQLLYHVPNFRTKLNLIELLMGDEEVFDKVILFCNTQSTASKVYQSLQRKIAEAVTLLKPDEDALETLHEWSEQTHKRVMIVPEEGNEGIPLPQTPFLIHFDLPEDKDTYISRVKKRIGDTMDVMAITFTTDLELAMVKKIENAIGQRISEAGLPEGLVVEKNEQKDLEGIILEDKPSTKKDEVEEDPTKGGAFQPKKASNAKEHNYKYKDKRKMAGKVSKRRNS